MSDKSSTELAAASPYVDAQEAKLPDHWSYGDTTQAPEAQGDPAQDLVQVRTGHGMATGTQPARQGHVRSSHQAAEEGDLTPAVAFAQVSRKARELGWSRTSGWLNGGWRVWEWFSATLGVSVTVTEQARGLFRLQVGCTTTAEIDQPTGGFGPVSVRQAVAVLAALGLPC